MPVATGKQKNKTSKSIPSGVVLRLRSLHWTSWLLLCAILFFALLRFHWRDMPLERDEGEYAYSGQLMLQGIPPYRLAYNMKLPGTYAVYALIMAIWGQSSAGIHTGFLVMNAATALLVFALGRKLFGGFTAAFAAISYSLLSSSPAVHGLAAHATHFVVIAALAGILLLIYALESDRGALFFLSGTCLGLAFLMKQPGIVFSGFALLYAAYDKRARLFDWRYIVSRGGALLGGMGWPFALTCLILYGAGVFQKFWFWTFSYAATYATTVPFAVGVNQLGDEVALLFRLSGGVWIIAALGLISLFWNGQPQSHSRFIGALLAFSFLGVAAGFHFREHYFVLLMPAAALLSGIAVGYSTQILRDRGLSAIVVSIPAVVFALAAVMTLIQERPFLFAPNVVAACHRMYYNNPLLEAEEIGRFLRENAGPSARIAVFGSEPEIYFYSQRHSATGYIYMYGLMEDQKYAAQMQHEMMDEVMRANPEYVVFVDDELSWLWQPGASREAFFSWIQLYVNTRYVKTAQVDIAGSPGHLLANVARIYVFKRKAL